MKRLVAVLALATMFATSAVGNGSDCAKMEKPGIHMVDAAVIAPMHFENNTSVITLETVNVEFIAVSEVRIFRAPVASSTLERYARQGVEQTCKGFANSANAPPRTRKLMWA